MSLMVWVSFLSKTGILAKPKRVLASCIFRGAGNDRLGSSLTFSNSVLLFPALFADKAQNCQKQTSIAAGKGSRRGKRGPIPKNPSNQGSK